MVDNVTFSDEQLLDDTAHKPNEPLATNELSAELPNAAELLDVSGAELSSVSEGAVAFLSDSEEGTPCSVSPRCRWARRLYARQ